MFTILEESNSRMIPLLLTMRIIVVYIEPD